MERLKEYTVVETVKVRWSEMDFFGHVNNNIYFRYFEIARFKYYEKIGIMDMRTDRGIGPIMKKSSCEYLHPLTYPDVIHSGVRVTRIGTTSFTMVFSVFSERAGAAAAGETVLVMYDYKRGEKTAIPDDVRKAIIDLEGRPDISVA